MSLLICLFAWTSACCAHDFFNITILTNFSSDGRKTQQQASPEAGAETGVARGKPDIIGHSNNKKRIESNSCVPNLYSGTICLHAWYRNILFQHVSDRSIFLLWDVKLANFILFTREPRLSVPGGLGGRQSMQWSSRTRNGLRKYIRAKHSNLDLNLKKISTTMKLALMFCRRSNLFSYASQHWSSNRPLWLLSYTPILTRRQRILQATPGPLSSGDCRPLLLQTRVPSHRYVD